MAAWGRANKSIPPESRSIRSRHYRHSPYYLVRAFGTIHPQGSATMSASSGRALPPCSTTPRTKDALRFRPLGKGGSSESHRSPRQWWQCCGVGSPNLVTKAGSWSSQHAREACSAAMRSNTGLQVASPPLLISARLCKERGSRFTYSTHCRDETLTCRSRLIDHRPMARS